MEAYKKALWGWEQNQRILRSCPAPRITHPYIFNEKSKFLISRLELLNYECYSKSSEFISNTQNVPSAFSIHIFNMFSMHLHVFYIYSLSWKKHFLQESPQQYQQGLWRLKQEEMVSAKIRGNKGTFTALREVRSLKTVLLAVGLVYAGDIAEAATH